MTKSPLNFVCICIRERPWVSNMTGCIKTLDSMLYQESAEDFHLHISGVYPTLALASGDCPLNTVVDVLRANLVCHCIVSIP